MQGGHRVQEMLRSEVLITQSGPPLHPRPWRLSILVPVTSQK